MAALVSLEAGAVIPLLVSLDAGAVIPDLVSFVAGAVFNSLSCNTLDLNLCSMDFLTSYSDAGSNFAFARIISPTSSCFALLGITISPSWGSFLANSG